MPHVTSPASQVRRIAPIADGVKASTTRTALTPSAIDACKCA
jgi:hypothetical protein